MRAALTIPILIILLFCNSCYKKYYVDETLHSSMLDESYMDFYNDSWYYFDHDYYEDNSDSEAKSFLKLYFKIPQEHLQKVDYQTKIQITHLNSGYKAVRNIYKDGQNDAQFTLTFQEPVHGTNFCYSIGAYNDSTETTINDFEGCYLFE